MFIQQAYKIQSNRGKVHNDERVCLVDLFSELSYVQPNETYQQQKNMFFVSLPSDTTGKTYREALRNALNKTESFAADITLVSMGFDGVKADKLFHDEDNDTYLPLLSLDSNDFAGIAKDITESADRSTPGGKSKVLFTLEGGYNISALKESVTQFLRELTRLSFKRSPDYDKTLATCMRELEPVLTEAATKNQKRRRW